MNIRKETIMKVYGSQICSGCRNYKAVQQSRGFEADYVDITASTANLREFLRLRELLSMIFRMIQFFPVFHHCLSQGML